MFVLKKKKQIVSCILIFILVISLLPMQMLSVFADLINPTDNTFKFITNVNITNEDGTVFVGPVKKDSKLRLQYDYAIPEIDNSIVAGQTYTFTIPSEIPIISQFSQALKDDDGNTFANVSIGTNNQGAITFTEFAVSLSNVQGDFWVYSQFDEEKIGNDGEQQIIFDLGSGQIKVITVNFEVEPETSDVKLVKTSAYNQIANEITWTIKVKPETTPNLRLLNNVVVKDIIKDNQTYIDGSVTVSTGAAVSYDVPSKELSIAFNNPINQVKNEEYTITFKTRPDVSGFTANGQTIAFTNQATTAFNDKDVLKVSTSNAAQVSIKSDFIKKQSLMVGLDKIDWTVTINNNYFSIDNAQITDKLPAGLTLDPSSVTLGGVSLTITDIGPLKYDEITRTLTYSFDASITTPQALKYRTTVTDTNAFKSNNSMTFTNEASLTGEGVPNNTKVGIGRSVPTSVIKKEAAGYNRSTQEITWRIIVNNNKIPMEGAVVTDSIPLGLEYVPDSFKIVNQSGLVSGFVYSGPTAGTHGRGFLTYTIPNDLTNGKTLTVEFKTEVLDNAVFAVNNTTNFSNTATLNYTGGPQSTSSATQQVVSEVIKKEAVNYNYNTRELEWKITINQNRMPLTNVVVTDTIPAGHKYVIGSSKLGSDPITPTNSPSNTLVYTIGDIGTTTSSALKEITFKTVVEDLTLFENNQTIAVKNIAKITADEMPSAGVTDDDIRNIDNIVVGKSGTYVSGKNYIDWQVKVNQNSLEILNPVLEDVLQLGLSLDTESVKLYKAVRANNGTLTKGDEVSLTAANIKYDGITRKFEFHFAQTIQDPYFLEFRTDIEDAYRNSTFTNTIYFKGSRPTQQSASSNIAVSFQIGGGSASGTLGSITLEKVDTDNNNTKLQGSKFQLIDAYGNVLSEKTTNSSGTITFDKLKFRTFYVKEVAASEGYVLNADPITVIVNGTNKDVTIQVKNTKIKGRIEFKKIDSLSKDPIEGAMFELFNVSGSTTGRFKSSGIDGMVAFDNVPYGSYLIREVVSAKYYKSQNLELKATISENGQTVFAGLTGNGQSLYSLENTLSRGNLKITKIDKDNPSNKLKSAVFRLYLLVGESEVLVSEKSTDNDGVVQWEDIAYGQYVLRELTAPTGYYLNTQQMAIELVNSVMALNFENQKIPYGNLVIYKIDALSSKPIENVEFEVYKADNMNLVIKKAKTDINGKVEFVDLLIGNYVVKEASAPAGYHEHKTHYTVTIESDKATSLTIQNDPLRSIVVKKSDEDNPTLVFLSGAVFVLKDEDNAQVGPSQTTDKDGLAKFENLKFGKYTLTEIEAPVGYLLNNTKFVFTIDEKSALTIVKEVTNISIPSKADPLPISTPTPTPTPAPTTTVAPTPAPTPTLELPEFTTPPNPIGGPISFILVDDEGNPLGVFTQIENSEGDLIYVDEDGIPLGIDKLPKTSDSESPYFLLIGLVMLCAGLFGLKKRQAN